MDNTHFVPEENYKKEHPSTYRLYELLVVMGVQKDSTDNIDGVMKNINRATELVHNRRGITTLYVKQQNEAGSHSFVKNTEGADFRPNLSIRNRFVMEKSEISLFQSKVFRLDLEYERYQRIYLAGSELATDIRETCRDLLAAGYPVTVLSECVAAENAADMEKVLAELNEMGCERMTLEEFQKHKITRFTKYCGSDEGPFDGMRMSDYEELALAILRKDYPEATRECFSGRYTISFWNDDPDGYFTDCAGACEYPGRVAPTQLGKMTNDEFVSRLVEDGRKGLESGGANKYDATRARL